MVQKQPSEVFCNKRCSQKFRKISEACNFIKKQTLAQTFSFEFCKIFKNAFFTEHLWAIASDVVYQPEKEGIKMALKICFYACINDFPKVSQDMYDFFIQEIPLTLHDVEIFNNKFLLKYTPVKSPLDNTAHRIFYERVTIVLISN